MTMRHFRGVVVAAGIAIMLAACGGGGSESGSAPAPAPAPAPQQPEPEEAEDEDETAEVSEAVLRMAITDETTGGLPERFEVWIRGTGSWFAAQDMLLEAAGPFVTGEPTTFFIYPEGRDTPEIEVELIVPKTVIPGSVRDLVEIEVYDTEIKIFGTSVPGFEAVYQR
jgi:hypothetical protein